MISPGSQRPKFHHGNVVHLLLKMARASPCRRRWLQRSRAIRLTRLKNVVARSRPIGDDRMRLSKIRYDRFRQSGLDRFAHIFYGRCAGAELEQYSLRRATADLHQARGLERFARHHQAQTDIQASRHSVWFAFYQRRDAKVLSAELHRVANLHSQANREVLADHDRIRVQRVFQQYRRIQLHFAVVRILRLGRQPSPKPARASRLELPRTSSTPSR